MNTQHLHDQYIRDNLNKVPIKRMAKIIGRSHGYVRGRIQKLSLHIDPEAAARFRKLTQFRKGQVSHNKGKKMPTVGRMAETQFKKGNRTHNTKQDGAITTRVHKRTGIPYKWIRISLGNWKELHRHIWEKHNGPIPEGHIVIFKDGDTLNCEISNLEMITMEENMKRNSIYNYPEEIVRALQTKGALVRQINKKLKENGKEKA